MTASFVLTLTFKVARRHKKLLLPDPGSNAFYVGLIEMNQV